MTLISSRKLRAYTQERSTAYKLKPNPSDPLPCACNLNTFQSLSTTEILNPWLSQMDEDTLGLGVNDNIKTSPCFSMCMLMVWVSYFSFPLHMKDAMIDPFFRIPPMIFVHTSFTSLALSAALSISSPQQDLECLHMFPVDWASFLSKCWIVALHPFAWHLNSCACQIPTSVMRGVGSKNA
jgi:hypothetical protein